MEQLNLPAYKYRLRQSPRGIDIFDNLRHRFVALTPEEWVRQHFVEFLISHKGYPPSLMNNEIALNLNGTRRRCDTVVFDLQGKPIVIIEYKAATVPISQTVFDQIVRYNMILQAKYLIASNGRSHYCCNIDYSSHSYSFLPEIPTYTEL